MWLWKFSRTALAVVAGLALAAAVLPVIRPGWERVFRRGTYVRCGGNSNETTAILTLRNLASAQEQFHAAGWADRAGDGRAGFGGFRELCGAAAVRDDPGIGVVDPPLLSGAFRSPDGSGVVSRSGYRFAIFLPARGGGWIVADRRPRAALDPEAGETRWRAYAWPAVHGDSGERTFFIDSAGTILSTDDPAYEGAFPIAGTAADPAPAEATADPLLRGGVGRDGNIWKPVH